MYLLYFIYIYIIKSSDSLPHLVLRKIACPFLSYRFLLLGFDLFQGGSHHLGDILPIPAASVGEWWNGGDVLLLEKVVGKTSLT